MGDGTVSRAENDKQKHINPPSLVAFQQCVAIPSCEQKRIDSEINGERDNAHTK
jgi:hypothetical protein